MPTNYGPTLTIAKKYQMFHTIEFSCLDIYCIAFIGKVVIDEQFSSLKHFISLTIVISATIILNFDNQRRNRAKHNFEMIYHRHLPVTDYETILISETM